MPRRHRHRLPHARPPRRLAPAPARRRGARRGRRRHGARVRACNRHAEPAGRRSPRSPRRAAYRDRILAALPARLALRAADDALPDRQHAADGDRSARRRPGFVHAVKYYPAGATTNSDSGVTALERVYPALAAMEKRKASCCRCTAKSPIADVDIFDRERVFVDRSLRADRARLPGAAHRARAHHDARGRASSSRAAPRNVAATITPQHLLYSRNALFAGGVRPHLLLPADPEARDAPRRRCVAAATSGNPKFFLGTDSRAARAAHQGARVRLRRLLLGAGRARALRRGVRGRGRARPARRLREPLRRRLLRPAAQRRHGDARARAVDGAGRVSVRRRHASCRCARAKRVRWRVERARRDAIDGGTCAPRCYPTRPKSARPSLPARCKPRGEESPGSTEQDAG